MLRRTGQPTASIPQRGPLLPVKTAGRLHFLDALRGLAALSVVVYHFFGSSSPLAHALLLNWQNLGAVGVYIFFLVSGFIIPRSLERNPSLWGFWRSRILRLFPPYWFSLTLVFLLTAAGLRASLHLSALGYLTNLSMTAFLVRQPALLGIYWTLSIELVFYVLCSALRLVGLLRFRFLTAFAAVSVYLFALVLANTGHLRAEHLKLELGLLVVAFVGSAFYQAQHTPSRQPLLLLLVPSLLATTLFAQFVNYRHASAGDANAAAFARSFSVSWIIALTLFTLLFLLRHRTFPAPLLWLGRISYSLYLTHILVGDLLAHFFGRGAYLLPTVKVLCSLAVADLCFRFVERPSFVLSGSKPRLPTASPLTPIQQA